MLGDTHTHPTATARCVGECEQPAHTYLVGFFLFSLHRLPARADRVTPLGRLRALSASFKAKIFEQDE